MQALARITVLILLLAATLATAVSVYLPEIANRKDIARMADSVLEQNLECNASIKRIRWSWHPLPGIRLEGVSISRHDFSLNATDITLLPDWVSLASGSPRISALTISNPKVVIAQISGPSAKNIDLSALPRKISIKNATVTLPDETRIPGLPPRWIHAGLKGIDSTVKIDPDTGTVSVTGSFHPPCAAEVQLHARAAMPFERNSLPRAFTARLKVTDIDLDRLFQKWARRHNAPTARKVNLALGIEGGANSTITGSLTANSPCILLPGRQKGIDLSCGVLNAGFKWSGKRLATTINKFILENPAISMNGTISVTLPGQDGGGPVSSRENEPYWDINLNARNIDLAGVRKVVLNLFGKQEVASLVCDIVRGGRAPSLTYIFQGSTSDFEFVDHMRLTALVDRAPIYIPDPDLFLEQASGPIRIENGILYGDNLTGVMGNSRAWNGSLALGLSEDLFQFELDLDLDADLAELKPLLARLVDNRLVAAEVRKFRGISGRAQGSLHMGPDLRDFDVYVKVRNARGKAFYDRLGWPVSIKDGRAEIGPESVSWNGVSGTAGSSSIGECSGSFDWKGQEMLTIDSLSANLDANETLAYLRRFPVLRREMAPAVTALHGRVAVEGAMLQGPVRKPELWKYRAPFSPLGLDISSPMLQGPWRAVSGSALLTQDRLTARDIALDIGSEKTVLGTSLSHRYLKDWQGNISLRGTYGRTFQDWLTSRGWLPPLYRLSVPCRLKGLDIEFSDSALFMEGKCLFSGQAGGRHELGIALSSTEQGFSLDRLEVKGGGENARLSLAIPAASGPFRIQWDGELGQSAADAILENNQILHGFIKGNFSLLIPLSQGRPPAFEGIIDAQGIDWPWGTKQPLTISALKCAGNGAGSELELLDLGINGDRLELKGDILAEKSGVRLDLSLHAPVLHQKNIQQILPAANGESYRHSPELARNGPPSSRTPAPGHAGKTAAGAIRGEENRGDTGTFPTIHGAINFSVDRYLDDPVISAGGIVPDAQARQVAEYSDLEGKLLFAPDGGIVIMADHGTRCGIDFSGNATFDTDGHETKSLLFHSPAKSETRIEEILSCIGANTTLIQGAVSLEAYVLLDQDDLVDGYLDLEAHDGKISRMSLLSGIFSVVNLVDFLGPDGWREITSGGLAFSRAGMKSTIKDNVLFIDNISIYGNGLNLFGAGRIYIDEKTVNATAIVSPLKTIDAIVTRIPLLGAGLGGNHKSFISFPVRIHGPLSDPAITPLPVKTVTDILRKIIMSPIQAPLEMIKNKKRARKRHGGIPVSRMKALDQWTKKKSSPLKREKRDLKPDE